MEELTDEFAKCSIESVYDAAKREFGNCCKNFPELNVEYYRRGHVQIEPANVCNKGAMHDFIVRLVRFIKDLKCSKKRFDVDLRWESEVLKGSVYYSHVQTTRVAQLEFDNFKAPWLMERLETAVAVEGKFVQLLQAELRFYNKVK